MGSSVCQWEIFKQMLGVDLYEKWEGNASSRTGEGGREVVQGRL